MDPFCLDADEPDLSRVYETAAKSIIQQTFPKGSGDWGLALASLRRLGATHLVLIKRSMFDAGFQRIPCKAKPGAVLSYLAGNDDGIEGWLEFAPLHWNARLKRQEPSKEVSAIACELRGEQTPLKAATWLIQSGKRRWAVWIWEGLIDQDLADSQARALIPEGCRRVDRVPLPGSVHSGHLVKVTELGNPQPVSHSKPEGREWKKHLFLQLRTAKAIIARATEADDHHAVLEKVAEVIGPIKGDVSEHVGSLVAAIRRTWKDHDDNELWNLFMKLLDKHRHGVTPLSLETELAIQMRSDLKEWSWGILSKGEPIKISDALKTAPSSASRNTAVRHLSKEAQGAGWLVRRAHGAVSRIVPPPQ